MKVLFFTGKGGVGKSTLAAAASWQLAEKFKVRLISLDPAHNLGDIFRVTIGKKGTWFSDRLLIEEVDVKEKASIYLSRETSLLEETYSYLKVLDLDKYFSLLQYSPGIEEHALLLALEEAIHQSETFNYVIFDTPPTGLTLRFLALPRLTLSWIERLIAIRKRILEKRETIAKLSGEKAGENAIEDPIMKRLKELRDRYERLVQIFGTDACGAIVVFNPDLLSVKEAGRLLEGLRVVGINVELCIQNKVRREDAILASQSEEEIKRWTGEKMRFFRVGWVEEGLPDTRSEPYRLKENLSTLFVS